VSSFTDTLFLITRAKPSGAYHILSSLALRRPPGVLDELHPRSLTSPSEQHVVHRPTTQPIHQPTSLQTGPSQKTRQKFLTLPDELLTSIADDVAPEDLPNFRLTCKTLANIAAKQFGEKRLAHRRFILAEYSLKGLVDMTAHPIFGPCIKSILFGADYLTNDLLDLMEGLESHKITDPAKAMDILQMYRECWIKRGTFLKSPDLSSMLEAAFTNISLHGTSPSLGIFNSAQGFYHKEDLKHGYGSSREYGNLPFTKFATLNRYTLAHLQDAYRNAHFRPKLLEFDLTGQEEYGEMDDALSKLLLARGQLRSDVDFCIRQGSVDVRVLSSLHLVEIERRSTSDEEESSVAEDYHLDLDWLGQPVVNALFTVPITHLRLKSCSMHRSGVIKVLKAFAGTLQVVEMVDVAISGHTDFDPTMDSILYCLRDDLHLQKLVLDDLRQWDQRYHDLLGETMAKGRFWSGQQQILKGLDVFLGFDGYGLDLEDLDDEREEEIRRAELRVQSMNYSEVEHMVDYAVYLENKAGQERYLEEQRKDYAEYKVIRAMAKEAMARVESGEFDT
jgi:hypothetical protein